MELKIQPTGKSKTKVYFSKEDYNLFIGRDIEGSRSEEKVREFIEKTMRFTDSFINSPLKGVVRSHGHHDFKVDLYANKSDHIVSLTMKHFDIEEGSRYSDYINGRI